MSELKDSRKSRIIIEKERELSRAPNPKTDVQREAGCDRASLNKGCDSTQKAEGKGNGRSVSEKSEES